MNILIIVKWKMFKQYGSVLLSDQNELFMFRMLLDEKNVNYVVEGRKVGQGVEPLWCVSKVEG